MNYVSINRCSSRDFKGISVILQVAGCSHKCEGCFVKSAGWWKHTAGQLFDEKDYQDLFEAASKPYVDNIVIQGGDLMYHLNVSEGISLCRRLRKELPDKVLVLYTGYTYTQLQGDLLRQPILKVVDYLVDGKFDKGKVINTPPFRGSSNQVIHKLKGGVSIEQS